MIYGDEAWNCMSQDVEMRSLIRMYGFMTPTIYDSFTNVEIRKDCKSNV